MKTRKVGILRLKSAAATDDSVSCAFRRCPRNERGNVATRLRYTHLSTLPPICAAPDFASWGRLWFYYLDGRHSHLVPALWGPSIDIARQPGFSAQVCRRYDSDSYVSWLDEVLSALGIAPAAFNELPIGRRIAFDCALRQPPQRALLMAESADVPERTKTPRL
jgi:hypothetical protein